MHMGVGKILGGTWFTELIYYRVPVYIYIYIYMRQFIFEPPDFQIIF